ncbi:DUF5789 family protein [Halapricum desulfuricans]|uniref:DUF2795 domain-containing protein n=1 Tax=Halapricum desulfuricans TaxID=2841257 RepID=A0A897NIH8_9EURY|nr:DUF2795 domain-containing protein [Halapricum desulfuricans]QSG08331.1 Uncharacterized protein HSR122_0927 [Halapricum desulfuricans]QSG12552.1 Uncharacterized protein HSBGL_2145 [Halapricum desulfuricans]
MKLTKAVEQFETHTYPATTEELIEAYGETELTLPNGTETLGEVLGRFESETFETAGDARTATYCAVSSKGIGRKYYSDRDPIAPGEDGPDPLSL